MKQKSDKSLNYEAIATQALIRVNSDLFTLSPFDQMLYRSMPPIDKQEQIKDYIEERINNYFNLSAKSTELEYMTADIAFNRTMQHVRGVGPYKINFLNIEDSIFVITETLTLQHLSLTCLHEEEFILQHSLGAIFNNKYMHIEITTSDQELRTRLIRQQSQSIIKYVPVKGTTQMIDNELITMISSPNLNEDLAKLILNGVTYIQNRVDNYKRFIDQQPASSFIKYGVDEEIDFVKFIYNGDQCLNKIKCSKIIEDTVKLTKENNFYKTFTAIENYERRLVDEWVKQNISPLISKIPSEVIYHDFGHKG